MLAVGSPVFSPTGPPALYLMGLIGVSWHKHLQSFAITNNVVMNNCFVLVELNLLEPGIAGSKGKAYVILLDVVSAYANLLDIPSMGLKHFAFPPAMYKIVSFSTALPAQCVVSMIDEKWHLNVVLISYCEIRHFLHI